MTSATPLQLFPTEAKGAAGLRDGWTQREAARRQNPAALQRQIMGALEDAGAEGMTDRELKTRILPDDPARWPSLVAARGELKRHGYVVTYEEIRDKCFVWYRIDCLPQIVNMRGI